MDLKPLFKQARKILKKLSNAIKLSIAIEESFNTKAVPTETDKVQTVKITKEDLEKSFELYEEKLVILAQKLSLQTVVSNDDYNPQTKYEYVEALGKEIPITEL